MASASRLPANWRSATVGTLEFAVSTGTTSTLMLAALAMVTVKDSAVMPLLGRAAIHI